MSASGRQLPTRWTWAALRAWWQSPRGDLLAAFLRSPLVVAATIAAVGLLAAGALAPWISPYDLTDSLNIELLDAFTPPVWEDAGRADYLLGTDAHGRDMLSAILFGLRTSLLVGLSAVGLALVAGVGLGLLAGLGPGWLDGLIMRAADVQLSFPAILVALIIDGLARSFLPQAIHTEVALLVVIFAIAAANWVRFARTVRACVLLERTKDYVSAAALIGRPPAYVAIRHILPNVASPIFVIATVDLGVAMLQEATLSFLGVGMPPDQPSLGTLVENGRNYLLSGEWWIAMVPGLTLVVLVLSINILGDWLISAVNPKLR